mmetsp:Transcript_6842/g.8269  ORF Transcript_6842/g.8269 Transcript_6842/m.8269 type:complete len:590 (-) Transcript_6842:715-2484(-)
MDLKKKLTVTSSDMTPEQLDEVISFIPELLTYVRKVCNAGKINELILACAKENRYNAKSIIVGFALKTLFQIKSALDSSEESEKIVRSVFSRFSVDVWISSIMHVFEFSKTPVISQEVKRILITTQVTTPETLDTLKRDLNKALGELSQVILGDFCELIMQACPNKKQIADVVGPILLLGKTDIDRKTLIQASSAFRTVVENCYTIFEIQESSINVSRGLSLSDNSFHGEQYLLQFFEIRDKKYLPIVDELFQYHKFTNIARGIFFKYKMLPEGWRSELVRLKESGENMDWFESEKVYFLSEETLRFPRASKEPFYYSLKEEDIQVIDRVVDEIIESEKEYFNYLHAFITTYVDEVIAISDGELGEEAAKNLGLTSDQINMIFGKRLRAIVTTIEKILVKLEVLVLVRDPIDEKEHNIGRAGILAEIMAAVSKELGSAYMPYNKHYAHAAAMLTKAVTHTAIIQPSARKVSKGKLGFANDSYKRHLTFLELWTEISESTEMLKGLRIDAILIKPVHRFPKYLLFFGRLEKVVRKAGGEGTPTYESILLGQKAMQEVTKKINHDINRYNDIQRRMFGEVVDGASLLQKQR